jgi:hypothetical protein
LRPSKRKALDSTIDLEEVSFRNMVRFFEDELRQVQQTRSLGELLTMCSRRVLRKYGVLARDYTRSQLSTTYTLTAKALRVLEELESESSLSSPDHA